MSGRSVRNQPKGARKSVSPKPRGSASSRGVTLERVTRLFRLVEFLAEIPRPRRAILQRLRIDIRTFYRDLEMLRDCGIEIILEDGKYLLRTKAHKARLALPFPDPGLNLGEAEQLAKGRSKVHQKIRGFLKIIMAE